MRRCPNLLALLSALALVAAACGADLDTGFPPPPTGEETEAEAPEAEGDIEVVDSAFDPKSSTLKVGDTVVWFQTGDLPHTVTSADGETFDSHPDCGADCLQKGETFEFTFEEAGEFAYYCKLHGTKDGQGMAGTITVEA